MSHVVSVSPAGPLTLAPGQSADLDVLVNSVPGDDSGTLSFAGSDGSTITVGVTVDRAALEGVVSGTAQAHQVLGQVLTGPGSLVSVGPIVGGWRFRYTAA